MAVSFKVENRDEIGYKKLVGTRKEWTLLQGFRFETLAISHAEVVENRSEIPQQSLSHLGNQMAGLVVGGLFGFLLVGAAGTPKWDMDVDIHLIDGRVIEVRAVVKSQVEALLELMVPNQRRQNRLARNVAINPPKSKKKKYTSRVPEDFKW